MAEYIRVKNWSEFQHYKDRNPPWIKLHNDLLHSRTWVTLDDASKALAVALMLLASRTDNKISADPGYIQRVAYLHTLPDLEKLLKVDFIEIIDLGENCKQTLAGASKVLANRTTETETYKTEKKEHGSSAAPTNRVTDDFEVLWKQYPKRSGSNPRKAALQAYSARRKEGVRHKDIAAGLKRYAAWVTATGKLETETVMQAKRFFGPGLEWENPWAVTTTQDVFKIPDNRLVQFASEKGLPDSKPGESFDDWRRRLAGAMRATA